MDYNDIILGGTTDVKAYCDTLDAGVEYYKNLVSELTNAKTEILNNWNGNTSDILDISIKVDDVVTGFEQLIPGISQLSSAVRNLADASHKIANKDVVSGVTMPDIEEIYNDKPEEGEWEWHGDHWCPVIDPNQIPDSQPDVVVEEKPGFWEWHGENFADAWTKQDWAGTWDYSGCDAGLDYVGKTVDAIIDSVGNVGDALLDTGGAVVNFVVDGVSEFLGWIFG